ncbi:MAG: winged helix-turn-helix transcriptional regulator [Lentisphaeria bacterium]|nr:winged helix-turn-helix transcriptional regulator [Lentisphaeria bacterium]
MTLNTRELKKDCAYRRIMEMIRLGRVTNGRFPSEPEFCKELNVSRVTLRAALKRLEQEGMITRSHYYGTRISSTRPMRKVLIADVTSNYRFCDRKMQEFKYIAAACRNGSCPTISWICIICRTRKN